MALIRPQSLMNDFFADFMSDPFFNTMPNQQLTTLNNNPNKDVGIWNWNSFLHEPIQMCLEENPEKYVMTLKRPVHLGEADLKVDVHNDMLTVSGEKKKESRTEKPGIKSYSSSYTCFCRSTRLPKDVDQTHISARMNPDGSLWVELPKKEDSRKPSGRNIPIALAH